MAHITDLVKIFESRTKVRFTTVSEAGTLRKQVEFSDTRFREITAEKLERHEQVPFRSGQDIVPGLPDVLTHTYDLGTDGRVASGLGVIFDQYLAGTDFRGPYRFIDAFTFAAVIEKFTAPLSVGDVCIRPATDSEFYGATYHSAQQYLYFDRIDLVDGLHQAFLKVHTLGNYTDSSGGRLQLPHLSALPARRSHDRPRLEGASSTRSSSTEPIRACRWPPPSDSSP